MQTSQRSRVSSRCGFVSAVLAFFVTCIGTQLATATPSISSLSVTSGPVNTAVTIAGSGFGAAQGTSTIALNGTAASPTAWSDTSIGINVPVGATTGPIVVSVGGANSNGVTFTVTPYITRLSLSTGPVQMGFVIIGTTFGSSQGTSSVEIGSVALSVISWTDTAITVSIPTGATTGNVVVTVNALASNGASFSVGSPFGCS